MARSDGYGTRLGHPAPARSGHQPDQSDPHHGGQPGSWPDGHDYGAQYPQEPYWQQPTAPDSYDPVAPAHPLTTALGGLAHRLDSHLNDHLHALEPTAPDPRYANPPPADPYGASNAYHVPQEPGYPYEPQQPRLDMPDHGHGFGQHPDQGSTFAAPEFPRFPDPDPGAYAPQHGFAPQDSYVPPQYEPSYQPASEQHPQQSQDPAAYQPYLSAQAPADAGYGQFHDYLPVAPPRGEPPLASAYPDPHPTRHQGDHGHYGTELPELRGAEFEDWPRAQAASDRSYQPFTESRASPATGDGGYAEPGWPQEKAFTPDSGPIFASAGYDVNQDLAVHPEYEDEEYYEDEEPEERRRAFPIGLISMALAVVVMVGGGMAYGYKMLLGPTAEVAGTPVVKSTSQPPKIRPEEPGGRTFDHTDSKILGRLSEQRNAASTEGQRAEDGSRRVSTVVIGRNGDIVAPVNAPTPSSQPPANPVVTVPGLTIVDGFGGRAAPAPGTAPQRPIVVQPPEASAPRSPARPVSVARAEPTSFAAAEPADPAARLTEPARRPVTSAVAPATPKASPPVTTASTNAAQASGSGYVAVLASVPVSPTSRMEALAQFADIQQSYGSVLGSRTPDVREANLGSRGRFHRLMVGPPGSKESAAELCSQLKNVGYSGCWITTY